MIPVFTRRNILKSSLPAGMGLTACATIPPALDETTIGGVGDSFSSDFIGPDQDPYFNTDEQLFPAGNARSRHDEIRTAFKLLWDSPRTSAHMDIARYFENITTTNPNETDLRGNIARYNEEWRTRSNPLITCFFSMTNTLPSTGDETPWCAAFVSFILYAAGKPNMFSALSGSYRYYLEETALPTYGDIVVFQKYGDAGARGFGHVGFFVSETEYNVTVLGGNQRGGTGSTGSVTETVYAKTGQTQKLHSYRKVPVI